MKIGEISQAVTDGDYVELGVGEREFEGVGLEVGNGWLASVGDGQHGVAEIAADGARPRPAERFGKVAGAATDIKGGFAIVDGSQIQHATLPKAMQAEALKVIDQIVTRGDAVKERANTGAAFGTRLVVSI